MKLHSFTIRYQNALKKLEYFMFWSYLILYFFLTFQLLGEFLHLSENDISFIVSLWWDSLVESHLKRDEYQKSLDKKELHFNKAIEAINEYMRLEEAEESPGLPETHKFDNSIISRFEMIHNYEDQCRSWQYALQKFSPTRLHERLSSARTLPPIVPDLPASALGKIYAFLGNMKQASSCRILSRSFNNAVHPGSTVYAELVRQLSGQLSREESTALWAQLVLRYPAQWRKRRRSESVSRTLSPLKARNRTPERVPRPAQIIVDSMENYYDILVEMAYNEPSLLDAVRKDIRRVLVWRRTGGCFLKHKTNSKMVFRITERITRIVSAFTVSRPETKYCQGMSFAFVFAMSRLGLLLEVSVEEDYFDYSSFHVDDEEGPSLDGIAMSRSDSNGSASSLSLKHMEWRCLRTLQTLHDSYGLKELYGSGIHTLTDQLQALLRAEIPDLWAHLDKDQINTRFFAVGWFESLFVYIGAVPLPTLAAIWDVWLAEADFNIFLQLSISILKKAAPTLLQADFEETVKYLLNIPCDIGMFEPGQH